MSRINIQGTIDNIRSKTNVYTPIIESIVNSIQSITKKNVENGKIEITLIREHTLDFENQIPPIKSISIRDNGSGFNKENRDSFDTFYSEHKKKIGGKGFGRFMFVKYFGDVNVESVFQNQEIKLKSRTFRFGRKYEIIVDETINDTIAVDTYSIINLNNLISTHSFDKNIETFSRKLLEKLLIFFINDSFNCPTIIVKEEGDNQSIILNDYISGRNEIQQIEEFDFVLKTKDGYSEQFKGKVFKIYFPGNQKSKISLTGHNREVTETNLHRYIPEFEDEFYDNNKGSKSKKNYIIKTYILGEYLDNNVSLEREAFDFDKEEGDSFYPFSQKDIETQAALETKQIFNEDISSRSDIKASKIRAYVKEHAPWHNSYVNDLDFSQMGYNLSNNEIEVALHKVKHKKEIETRSKFTELLENPENFEDNTLSEMVNQISEIGKSDLAHYVYNRKCILQAFKEMLKRNDEGKGHLEKEIHNIIYPMTRNSENTTYEEHNLWLLDERLVFSEYISSDEKISSNKKNNALDEPDLLIFDQKSSFRAGDNEFSNPLTIFEFKRPKRNDYAAKDDPILQIGRYLEKIRDGKYEMPDGLEPIKINDSTPIYGYVIADITPKIKEFARNGQLTESPDKEGFFGFHNGFKMYVEIISFKKLLKDATLRNKIFFKKLQLE
ncbi:ATP-binding protein [Cellulophaga sp. L1A9]|uniref:ATP-binding protein n=1 Tax=Cellulophaga sp. L1A9 TaxID=2686362 RepID=UPI00131D307C|nr:ATP-binding protein [Cellulophaga sp. L1A9]